MANSSSFSYLTPEFDDFLFARLDGDADATPLSVLSVLARLGIDPWEEAARLAALPRVSAAKRLVTFIEATPGASSAYLNAKTVCDRLVDLLPSASAAGVAIPPLKAGGVRALTKSPLVIGAVVLAVILALQLIMMSRQPATLANEPQATSVQR